MSITFRKSGLYWLASYPRSGNTWVRLFLRAYMKGFLDLNGVEDVVTGVHNELYWQTSTTKPVSLLQGSDRLALLETAMRNALYNANGADVRLKTHDANVDINDPKLTSGLPRRIIPWNITAGAVYLVRDPRDVACSYAHYKNCSIDDAIEKMNDPLAQIGSGSKFYEYAWHFMSSWSNHVKSWSNEAVPDGMVHHIRYEDLHTHPEVLFPQIVEKLGLRKIDPIPHMFERLGLQYDEERRVRASIELTNFERLKKEEQEHGFNESGHKGDCFFRRGEIGGWQDTLTPEQADRIVNDHGEVMEALGYIGEKNAATNESGDSEAAGGTEGRTEALTESAENGGVL